MHTDDLHAMFREGDAKLIRFAGFRGYRLSLPEVEADGVPKHLQIDVEVGYQGRPLGRMGPVWRPRRVLDGLVQLADVYRLLSSSQVEMRTPQWIAERVRGECLKGCEKVRLDHCRVDVRVADRALPDGLIVSAGEQAPPLGGSACVRVPSLVAPVPVHHIAWARIDRWSPEEPIEEYVLVDIALASAKASVEIPPNGLKSCVDRIPKEPITGPVEHIVDELLLEVVRFARESRLPVRGAEVLVRRQGFRIAQPVLGARCLFS